MFGIFGGRSVTRTGFRPRTLVVSSQYVRDLWHTKCHLDWFFSPYSSFLISICVGFVVDEVSLGQVFLRVLYSSPLSMFGIYGGRSVTWTGFSPRTLLFSSHVFGICGGRSVTWTGFPQPPVHVSSQYHSTNLSYSFCRISPRLCSLGNWQRQ